MLRTVSLLAASALIAGSAFAQSSADRAPVKVKRAPVAQAMAIAKGEAPQGLWCDSLGYQWNLSGAGRDGRVVAVTGSASICGDSPVAGGLTLAQGLPLDVTASVNPGCFCNEFHQMQLTWNKNAGVFEGTAYAFGSCEGSAPVTLGAC